MQQRSRAYPAVNLETALQLLEKLVEALGWGAYDRDEAARALGYRGSTGLAARKVAALSHFGLLDRSRGGRYEPSGLADKLLNPESKSSFEAYLRDAFMGPALFKEVVDHHEPIGKIPEDFPEALATLHGITDSASTEVANLFVESAIFAKVISPDGVFIARKDKLDKGFQEQLNKDENGEALDISHEAATAERQIFKLSLSSGGHALIELPKYISRADVEMLRRVFEIIEIQGEKSESLQEKSEIPRPLRWVKGAAG